MSVNSEYNSHIDGLVTLLTILWSFRQVKIYFLKLYKHFKKSVNIPQKCTLVAFIKCTWILEIITFYFEVEKNLETTILFYLYFEVENNLETTIFFFPMNPC